MVSCRLVYVGGEEGFVLEEKMKMRLVLGEVGGTKR